MGFNTTVLVLNDALSQIENDKEFGAKLAAAIRKCHMQGQTDIHVGNHVNAVTVIESHHSNEINAVFVGGNSFINLGYAGHYKDDFFTLLSRIAKTYGFTLKRS